MRDTEQVYMIRVSRRQTRSCCVKTSKHSSRLSAVRCWLSALTCLTLGSSTAATFTLLRDIHLQTDTKQLHQHDNHQHGPLTAKIRTKVPPASISTSSIQDLAFKQDPGLISTSCLNPWHLFGPDPVTNTQAEA